MWRRYLVAATPAFVMIGVGWLTPLIVDGRFQNTFLAADGGGRVLDKNGVCCVEPTYYFIARVAATVSPLVGIVCLFAMAIIWVRSKARSE